MTRLQKWPRIQACIAGSSIGLASSWWFPLGDTFESTMFCGAAALIGTSIFIRRSTVAYPIREMVRLRNEGTLAPPRPSISDLIARMTVAAILIVDWTTVLSWEI